MPLRLDHLFGNMVKKSDGKEIDIEIDGLAVKGVVTGKTFTPKEVTILPVALGEVVRKHVAEVLELPDPSKLLVTFDVEAVDWESYEFAHVKITVEGDP